MRFTDLHEYALTNVIAVFNIEDDTEPTHGFAVPDSLVDSSRQVLLSDFNLFKEAVEALLKWGEGDYIIIYPEGDLATVATGHLFYDKMYAIGYSHGAGHDTVIDVFEQRVIRRGNK